MKGGAIEKAYRGLSLLSVFHSLQYEEPFASFFTYFEEENANEKRKAYARFVAQIYEKANGDLTLAVWKATRESENIFIKSVASGKPVSDCLKMQVEKELKNLSFFAALSTKDFALDLEENENDLPAFTSLNKDMGAAYFERVQNIEKYGYGIFSSFGMFRIGETGEIEPVMSADSVRLNSFIGYEEERAQIVENTKALLKGKAAANALLCGDAGTGKSSTVKAVANEFFSQGLRLIELRKDELRALPKVMARISGNPLKFIIFIDDLAFNRSNDDFSMLKAVLEGSASAKSNNAVIYATSNRRHIIKESFSDREGDDVHRNDTLQETLSLSERFGLVVRFQKPDKKLYLTIVETLAQRANLQINEALFVQAEAFALRKGNRSARCAEQFIQSLL